MSWCSIAAMSNIKLTETVTVEREVPRVIRDLVLFALYLREVKVDFNNVSNKELIAHANDFWDREHGED